ncbi:MAG TPA: rhomboid family intramembrane serine protease [Aeromicrobium sp.]|nr:rhomboid family intramembrane serine protease [Aeromicrobium sp.]
MTDCYRHAGREANIRCQRCERPICPDCMRDASVGFQCPTCVDEGRKSVRQPRTVAGGAIPADVGRASLALIAINIAVFLAQLATAGSPGSVTQLGQMDSSAVASGQYWRLLTGEFLHGGPLHLVLNMFALYLFGPAAERALGTVRFLASYLTMAVAASTFVYALTTQSTVGASGAIFGLFGLVFVLLLKAGQDVRGLIVLLGVNGLISLNANISWQAHLGGFLTGIVLGAVFAYAPRSSRTLWQVLAFAAIWAGIGITLV